MSEKKTSSSSGHGKKKKEYRCSHHVKDGNSPVYCGIFNMVDRSYFKMFASVSLNKITVYQCTDDGMLEPVQIYKDDHEDESFFTIAWTRDRNTGHPLLAASGFLGTIRIIDCVENAVLKSFVGHGNSVNELRIHPLNPHLLLSASKDESLRLWNIETGICCLILGGASGHRNEVLSVDFHPANTDMIASCGMDMTVRIWLITDFLSWVQKSTTWEEEPSDFPTQMVNHPIFVLKDIHSNYIDCIRWNGNLLLSKSIDDEVVLWMWTPQPEESPSDGVVEVLQQYPVPDCNLWFMKFGLDFFGTVMAVGNRDGKCFVWDMDICPPAPPSKLSTNLCRSPIRQTAVSFDARIIICCCENGELWRWDLISD